jgi:hypothetical protein
VAGAFEIGDVGAPRPLMLARVEANP